MPDVSPSPLRHYIQAFSRLRTAWLRGERAPHKPILLLAVLDSIAAGELVGNRIYITPELVVRFKDLWSRYVTGTSFKSDFTKPFYHLTGDRFWHLQSQPNENARLTSSRSPSSFSGLRSWVAYAYLDTALFDLLQTPETRELLHSVLTETYFPGVAGDRPGYIDTVTQQILTENGIAYGKIVASSDEEEIISRSAVFKRVVPRIYNFTCCVSGMQLISTTGVQMIDACHIVPFAESYDDTISNGLSLCPNLHRAFDRGLFRIDGDYRVRFSNVFVEAESVFQLRLLEGKEILLPQDKDYWPSLENLTAHGNRWRGNF